MKDDIRMTREREFAKKLEAALRERQSMFEEHTKNVQKGHTPPAIAAGHKHVEAFCLMTYQCKGCGHREIIWNSRDGVTPFSTRCPSCGNGDKAMGEMGHIAWNRDVYAPEHKLHRYQKFWRDMTCDEAITVLRNRHKYAQGTRYARDEAHLLKQIQTVKDNWGNPDPHSCAGFHKGEPMLDVYLGE